MRFLYLDDAGTSSHEPHAVVAGVLVHADGQLGPLESHMEELTGRFIPESQRDGFAFHLTELWSGTRFFKDRERWPFELRAEIMRELSRVPALLALTIVHGHVDKELQRQAYPLMSPGDLDQLHHATAFARCILLADMLMREQFPKEVLQIVAEDSPGVRKRLVENHLLFSDQGALARVGIKNPGVQYRHVKNDILFGTKRSKPLQIADMCAFFIRGRLAASRPSAEFFSNLEPRMAFPL